MKKLALTVFLGGVLLAGGCSSLVAMSGTDPAALASMDQVHKEFGKPKVTGMADGKDYEEFTTHNKMADSQRAGVLVAGNLMTCGLGELFFFPYEMALLGKTVVSGDTVRVCYDMQGNVTEVYVDGEQVSLRTNVNRIIDGPKTAP
jgi:hypothetical protein